MVEVVFLGPVNKEKMSVEATNLSELKAVLKNEKDLEPWLEICAVAVNEKMVCEPNFALKNGDKIALLPPVCGG